MACSVRAYVFLDNENCRAPWLYSSAVISVLVCAIGAVCFYKTCWQAAIGSRKRNSPPGPKGLPIIGHLHLLGRSPHRALSELSKLHGPLMWLRFGSIPVIVASSPQAARLILQTHDQIFSGRPRLAAAVATFYNCTNISFSPANSHWRRMRQLCLTELLSPKRVEAFRHVREAESLNLVRAIMKEIMDATNMPTPDAIATNFASSGGVPIGRIAVSVRPHVLQASNNMISKMVLGTTLREMMATDSPFLKFLDLIDELLQCLSIYNLSDLFPVIAWLDIQGVRRRSRRVARALDIVLEEILNSRRHKTSHSQIDHPDAREDLLDRLLSLASEENITDDNIKAVIQDMFIGGTDTSAYTIEWALAELLANPNEMKLVQEEIEKVVGMERMVKESDIAHLPYLRAVINETMRLRPIGPLLAPHMATQSCKLMGYDVLKNTQVFVNAWAIGRDSDTWSEPLLFKPERFLNNNLSVLGKTYEFLPFGAGRRGCPGSSLGLLFVQIQLANLLQGFHWWTSPNFDMQDKFGITTTKENPLVPMVALKLPPHVYFARD